MTAILQDTCSEGPRADYSWKWDAGMAGPLHQWHKAQPLLHVSYWGRGWEERRTGPLPLAATAAPPAAKRFRAASASPSSLATKLPTLNQSRAQFPLPSALRLISPPFPPPFPLSFSLPLLGFLSHEAPESLASLPSLVPPADAGG